MLAPSYFCAIAHGLQLKRPSRTPRPRSVTAVTPGK